MPEIPKYNGTTDLNEHVTFYTCTIKGNNLEDDEIESVLLKKFGETRSKGAIIWYHNLPPNSIDSFAMLVDAFVKEHAGAIKVETRKSDLFKVKQRDNEMLREFVSRFQMDQMDLPPVAGDWVVQAFTQGLNTRSSLASQQLKKNLIEYLVVTWVDVHNWGSGSERNPVRSERRNDQGQNNQGLMSKGSFDRPIGSKKAPRLSEYNFNVNVAAILAAIGRLKDTKWPRPLQPLQSDPA
ncbi:uncharacterized protein [Nicotiana sylvestris]|uniref:uncharacterized protein n=1 Tax=Nicotiana sylvestris TaxID=4096 RepID=UPI00388CC26E